MVPNDPLKLSMAIGKNDNTFGQLRGIACSNNGMWAVADLTKNCVHVFDSQDNLIKRLGRRGSKPEESMCPYDVAFDFDSQLYVVDSQNHRVQKFDSYSDYRYVVQFGGKGRKEGQLNRPLGITIYQNKVYAADSQNNCISVFQSNGTFCTVIGQQWLSHQFDIAVNIDSEILAADWGHGYIYVFTLDGD